MYARSYGHETFADGHGTDECALRFRCHLRTRNVWHQESASSNNTTHITSTACGAFDTVSAITQGFERSDAAIQGAGQYGSKVSMRLVIVS